MSDISILFARDPLGMSDEDFAQIVQKFREGRSSFIQAPAAKAPTKAASAKKPIADLDLDLGDLGI